jgi:hypothetical protein
MLLYNRYALLSRMSQVVSVMAHCMPHEEQSAVYLTLPPGQSDGGRRPINI